jgi:fluoride ion exporter CrcB/FEX
MKIHNISLEKRLLLAILSGALVIPFSFLENHNPIIYWDVNLIDLLIGAVFGLLVMVPYQTRRTWLKSIALIISSVVIYVSMAKLVINQYGALELNTDYGIVLSGVLGALLVGVAVMLIAPMAIRSKYFALLLVTGAIGGFVFSYCIESQSVYINSLGYICWQTLVCFALHQGKK